VLKDYYMLCADLVILTFRVTIKMTSTGNLSDTGKFLYDYNDKMIGEIE